MNAAWKQRFTNLSATFPARDALATIVIAALAMTALSDWLFFRQPIADGWIIGAFSCVLLIAIVWTSPSIAPHRAHGILFAGITALCLRSVYDPNIPAMVLMAIGLVTFAISKREGWPKLVELWVVRWIGLLLFGWMHSWLELMGAARRALLGSADECMRRKLGLWMVPLLLGAVFMALFTMANPVIAQAMSRVWSWLSGFDLSLLSAERSLFWLLVFTFMMVILGYRVGVCEPTNAPAEGPEADRPGKTMDAILTPGVIVRALLVFNVLFAVQTGLDLAYLWGGAALPKGMTYAEYAQRGAYPLVVAALLAGAFVLAAFQPGSDGRDLRIQRKLVYLWLGQTLLLVWSSAWRLWLYVGAYSMTRLRFAAAVWMLLVALGLVWIVVRMARRKSGRWLINVNAITTTVVLYLCAMTGIDSHIAWFNVKHCEEVLGKGYPALDIYYLHAFKEDALPALLWLYRRDPHSMHEAKWRDAIWVASTDIDAQVQSWRGWTLRRAGNHADWSTWRMNLEERFSFGKVVSVSENTLKVREYDFRNNVDVHATYEITPETEFGNIQCISELQAGDDVVMDYREEWQRRLIVTLVREETTGDESHPPEPAPPPVQPTLPPPPPDTTTPVPFATVTATGRVVALSPGRIVMKEPGETHGSLTNRSYIIARRAELRGIDSLSKLQHDQRVVYRVIEPEGKPTIIELAVPGFTLSPEVP